MERELERCKRLIGFLDEALSGAFEASLFSLEDPNYPALLAYSGEGHYLDKLRLFVAEAACSKRLRDRGYFANHPVVVDETKLLKASVYLIRTEEGALAGALCLSMRCDLFFKMSEYMTRMLQFNMEELDGEAPVSEAPSALREPSLETIGQMVEEFGVAPERLTQAERQEILVDLYDMGAFRIKGAVAKAAQALKMSEQSVYRYLAKIKKARDW